MVTEYLVIEAGESKFTKLVYPAFVLENAVSLYENAPVIVGPPFEHVTYLIEQYRGRLKNVYFNGTSIMGEIKLLNNYVLPTKFRLSHNVMAKMKLNFEVESIEQVESVSIVELS